MGPRSRRQWFAHVKYGDKSFLLLIIRILVAANLRSIWKIILTENAILSAYDADISYRVVSRFYTYLYEDSQLSKYFVGQDEINMKVRFRHFLASFSETSPFAGAEYLERTHSGIDVTEEEFERFCSLLNTALLQEKVTPLDADSICTAVKNVKIHIVRQ